MSYVQFPLCKIEINGSDGKIKPDGPPICHYYDISLTVYAVFSYVEIQEGIQCLLPVNSISDLFSRPLFLEIFDNEGIICFTLFHR